MKRFKSLTTMLIVVSMLVGLFSGCGSQRAATSNNNSDSANQHMDISLALWGIGDAVSGKSDAVYDKIKKKLNITIKPQNLTWDDYNQKVQIWAASGQLPDVFAADAVSTPNYKKWINEGLVKAIPDDLSKYPYLKQLMDKKDCQAYRYPMGQKSGKIYAIPRPNYFDSNDWAVDNSILIRKDWMEKVGITKLPDTMDDFIALLSAFITKDPGGNGKGKTVGLTCYSPSWLSFLMLGYQPGVGSFVKDKENPGKWIPAFMTKDCLEGLKAIKKLYDSGCLDKDFATLKGDEGMDKFAAGKAGAYAHGGDSACMNTVYQKLKKTYPDKKWSDSIIEMHPLTNADGNKYRVISRGPWSESYINTKVNDAKMDRILKLFDYYLSPEGFDLIHYGIEGIDYKKDGDKIIPIVEKDSNGQDVPLTKKYPITGSGFLAEWSGRSAPVNPLIPLEIRDMAKNEKAWRLSNCKPTPTDTRLQLLDYPSKAKDVEKFDDDLVKVVLSKDPDKTWNDIVNKYKTNGYEQIIREINDLASKNGIKPQ